MVEKAVLQRFCRIPVIRSREFYDDYVLLVANSLYFQPFIPGVDALQLLEALRIIRIGIDFYFSPDAYGADDFSNFNSALSAAVHAIFPFPGGSFPQIMRKTQTPVSLRFAGPEDLLNDFDCDFFIFFRRRSTYYGSESTGDATLLSDDFSHIFRGHPQLNRDALFLFSFSLQKLHPDYLRATSR